VKILLDENIPHALRRHLRNHETATSAYMGFGGCKNGALLKAAEDAGFDVLVTGDRSLEYERNLSGGRLAVVALSANSWNIVRHYTATIAAAVHGAKAGEITTGRVRRVFTNGAKADWTISRVNPSCQVLASHQML